MGRNYNTLKFRCEFPEIPMLKMPIQSSFDDTASVSGYTELGQNDQCAPGTVFCFAYALPYTYTDLLSDLQNCKKFLLKNSGIIAAQVENSKNGDEVMTPTTQSKSLMLRKIQQDEGRQVLTKNQIA